MKNQKCLKCPTVGTASKFYRKIVERDKVDISYT